MKELKKQILEKLFGAIIAKEKKTFMKK